MVDHVLRKDPSAIMRLVRAELAAGAEDAGPAGAGNGTGHGENESFGIYLLAAARKPGPPPTARPCPGPTGPPPRPRPPANAAPVPLRLAGHAPGGFRTRFQAAFRDRLAAVRALAVAAVLDTLQRVHDLRALGHGRGQHRVGPVRFGQAGPHVRLVLGEVRAAGHRPLVAQDRDGTVQVVARRLQALAYGDGLHGSSCFIGAPVAQQTMVPGGPGCAQGPQNNVLGAPREAPLCPPAPARGDPRAQNHPPWARSAPDRCSGPS